LGTPIDEVYGAEKHETLLRFNPFKLTVVGVDCDDRGHVLADPRVSLGFDEEMVQTFMAMGNIVPIAFRKNGKKSNGQPNTEVVFGRGRVLSMREAWRRMRKAGVPEKDLPLIRGVKSDAKTEEEFLAEILVENHVRRPETIIGTARKAHRLYLINHDMKRTAERCKVSVQTLGEWFKMLALAPVVQKWIEDGGSGYAALDLLKDVPAEQQPARWAELVAAGKVKGLAAASEVQEQRQQQRNPAPKATDGEPPAEPVRLPRKREIRQFREVLGGVDRDQTYTRDQVKGLVDFLVDGKPLRGPLRSVWGRALEALVPAAEKASRARLPAADEGTVPDIEEDGLDREEDK
jgi:ParB family transcriptional regulator, chromosome partitioning protein